MAGDDNLEAEAARAAADRERRTLLTVLEQLPVGVHVAEAPGGRLVLDNAAIRAICGEAPLSEGVADYSADYAGHHPPGHPRAGEPLASHEWPLARAIATGEAARDQLVEIRRADGTRRLVSISATPVHDTDGRVVSAVATIVDVTDQVLARTEIERTLAASTQAGEDAAAAAARAEAVLASIADPFYLLDRDWRFTYVNDAAEPLLQATRDRLLGRTLWEAFPGVAGSPFEGPYREAMATGHVTSAEAYFPPLGTWFDVRSYPWAEGLMVHFRDIGARKAAEAERERLLAEAEAARERTARLQALTAALSMASDLDDVAAAVVAHGTDALGAVGTVITLRCPDGEHLEIMAVGNMPEDVQGEWRRFPIDAPVPLAEVARTGRPLFLESREQWAAQFPGMAPLLEATGHHANGVAPLVADGRVIGVLGVAFDRPHPFGDDDRSLLLAVAQLCAQALERARLFEAERSERAEAERARAEAEAANRAKSDFLAVMSHELRTPLNAIGGYAELIEMGIRGPVTPQQAEDLRRLQASQRHLLGLINEVLNYAKLETGTVQFDMATVRVGEALAGAEALVAPQAQAKALTLVTGGHPPDLTVRADAEKLRQVLVNLLSNAVKFTDRGGRIELACAEDGDRVRVTVRDTGIGIAADQLERIFDPFVQVRADLTRTAEGAGLGLAISRDLARGMGGDLEAASTPGEGSTFTLTLGR